RHLPRSRTFRVHHFRGIDSLREKANPPIDLAQPPLAVLIVGVFTTIAVACSPRHHLRHGRAFPGEQKPVLLFEALQPTRRYVVLASRRGLVSLRFSRKPFSHIVVLTSANPVGASSDALPVQPSPGRRVRSTLIHYYFRECPAVAREVGSQDLLVGSGAQS